jgi:CheY-like chemotaxis protein
MGQQVLLMLEDNPADVVFFREALEATGISARLEVVEDGEQAMQFLRRQNGYADAPRPDVMVLDLNVPIKNGREVMEDMAGDPALNSIPVAVLTTSTSERSICELYPSGRCLYFVKTDDFRRLQDIVREIVGHARTG